MSSNNKKELESGYTDLEENQNYLDMTKALIFSLVLVALGLIIVLTEIFGSSSAQ